MPLFSIITVCYNSEKTIGRTLDSVLHQTVDDYEYIIIDGASTDKTLEIVNSYQDKFGDKLEVFSEPDNGIYDAMNKGINKASGELIGIVNSDDYYELDALENISKEYKKILSTESGKDIDIVLYGMLRLLEEGKEFGIEFYNHNFLGKVMLTHPTCFVSKTVYEKYGAFDTQYRSAADMDFLLRVKMNTNTMFYPVYDIISNFERGSTSASAAGAKEAAEIRNKFGLVSKGRVRYEAFTSWLREIYRKFKK